jgi:hypothetical protein
MAITTQDGVLAGMQPPSTFVKAATGTLVIGRPQILWGLAGNPGAGGYSATINGANNVGNAVAGQIQRTDPGSGNSYLARLAMMASQPCQLVLADMLWTNQLTVNSTSAQAIAASAWPARDRAGTTNGDGVQIAVVTSAAASATAVAATLTYTNQAGTAGNTASLVDATAATATIAGAMFRFGLQAGDTGVRTPTSITFSTAWTTGTINLIAYRILAKLSIVNANVPNDIDALTAGFPRIFNGSVPFLFMVPSATTATNVCGEYVETQG